jgi:hypothetical protein
MKYLKLVITMLYYLENVRGDFVTKSIEQGCIKKSCASCRLAREANLTEIVAAPHRASVVILFPFTSRYQRFF